MCVCVLFSLTLYRHSNYLGSYIGYFNYITYKTWVYISPPSSWGRLSKILTLFILTFILLISLKFYACFFSFLFFFIFFIFEFIFVRKSGAAHPTPTPMVRVCYTYKFFSIDNNRKSIYKYGFFSPPSSVSTNCSGVDRKPLALWICIKFNYVCQDQGHVRTSVPVMI